MQRTRPRRQFSLVALFIWNPSGLSTIQEHPIKEYLSFHIHQHQHQQLSHSSRQITTSLTGSSQVLGPPTPKSDQGNGTFLKVCDQAATTKFLNFLGKISCLSCWKSTGHSRRGRGNTAIGHHPLMILDGFIKQYVARIFCVANIVTAHTGMRHCHGNPGLTHQIKQWIMLINFLVEKRFFGIDYRMSKLITWSEHKVE